MKILVTGANGQLGWELAQRAPQYNDWEFKFYDHAAWDITNEHLSNAILSEECADILINTAAYTKVDLAETEIDLCIQINSLGPKYLAKACRAHDMLFIHFSTDYVFQQSESKLISEKDPKNPKGVYAQSKSDGEDAILDENPLSLIIRCSWLYSSHGHNFVKTMLRLGQSKPILKVVQDQKGSPTYAEDLSNAILEIIRFKLSKPNEFMPGIYHYCNAGLCTWLEFAREIFTYCKMDVELHGISTSEYAAPAPRPPFSGLDCSKIKQTFQLDIPHWKESLHRCLDKLCNTSIHSAT